MQSPLVGIIANPVSARDIRRVIANANSLQVADRANIVLRALAALAACGVAEVVMMPDMAASGHVLRGIDSRRCGETRFPRLSFLEMPVTGTVDDTLRAARLMRAAGVAAIVVLGGDGTHRAVVTECGTMPIAGISTGTNNAFPASRADRHRFRGRACGQRRRAEGGCVWPIRRSRLHLTTARRKSRLSMSPS